MDFKKKKKPLPALKLNVQLDDVSPEHQHTTTVSAKKLTSDLFFSEPVEEPEKIQNLNDFHQTFLLKEQVVADVSIKKAGRKKQEDRFVGVPQLTEEQFFYGVFDGHGGNIISNLLQSHLHLYLQSSQHFRSNLEEAIKDTYKKINERIHKLQEDKKIDGGSTALCVINDKKELYVVNLGDSACVVVQSDFTVEKINQEHKLSREDELKRVENLCTVLDRQNVPRINGELAVTRSFGDKKHSEAGLIADPEIIRRKITDKDKYLMLATDGFWDIMSLDEVSGLLRQWESRNSPSIESLANYLLEEALNKNTHFKKDNMTLLTVDLQKQMRDVL